MGPESILPRLGDTMHPALKSRRKICRGKYFAGLIASSTFADGAIGKSYLAIINNFSAKLDREKVRPDKIIELEKIDTVLRNQKIESVCIITERKNKTQLAMVADNDDGSSTIFRFKIKTD